MDTRLPPELFDLLSNSLVLDNVINYLPLASRFALARTSRSYRDLVLQSPFTFRAVDLSRCRGAYIPYMSRVDSGGQSFRAERMDESLTEDDFYSGPLRGVLRKLHRQQILRSINTLVLDGLASVTNDLLHEIVTSSDYNVRLLSIRRCPNVNQAKLQQLLAYICRPGRPEGTPRLQGLYFFTDPGLTLAAKIAAGVTSLDGAQLGALPTAKIGIDDVENYYTATGRVVQIKSTDAAFWAHTIDSCRGVIWFDAVLCSHMHTEMTDMLSNTTRDQRPDAPTIATLALGPAGCTGCGRAPLGAPVWGKSEQEDFPLLWPPPASGRVTDAIRPPVRKVGNKNEPNRLIVSCQWCVDSRHCDSCHKWWCGDCYNPKKGKTVPTVEDVHPGQPPRVDTTNNNTSIKVHEGFCVEHCLRGELMAGAGEGGMWG